MLTGWVRGNVVVVVVVIVVIVVTLVVVVVLVAGTRPIISPDTTVGLGLHTHPVTVVVLSPMVP